MNCRIRLLLALTHALGTSHPQAVARPSTPPSITRAPADLSGQIALTWSAVTGAACYQVKRGASATAIPSTIGPVTTTDFTDATATPGTSYYYTVTTTDAIDGTLWRSITSGSISANEVITGLQLAPA